MKKWARHLHSLWTGIRKKEIQLPMWKQTALDANQHATISSFPHKLPKHTPPTFKYIFMLRIYPYSYFIMSILPLIFLPLPSNRVAFLINKRPCFGNSLGWSFVGLTLLGNWFEVQVLTLSSLFHNIFQVQRWSSYLKKKKT